MHTVHRMRRLRSNSKEIRHYLLSFLRYARRESLVSHQFLACHRHLYRFKKFGGFLHLMLWMPLRYLKLPPAIPQHSRLHDIQESNDYTYREYLIFLSLTVVSPISSRQAYGEVIWFGGRVTALTFVSFIFMVRPQQFLFRFETDYKDGHR
jgi:hypothetical protein